LRSAVCEPSRIDTSSWARIGRYHDPLEQRRDADSGQEQWRGQRRGMVAGARLLAHGGRAAIHHIVCARFAESWNLKCAAKRMEARRSHEPEEPTGKPGSTGNRIQRVRMSIASPLAQALLRQAFPGRGCFRRERLERGLYPGSAGTLERNLWFAQTPMPNTGEKDNCSGLRRQARANLSSGAPEFQDFTHRLVSEC
jgi:hypothetical protein